MNDFDPDAQVAQDVAPAGNLVYDLESVDDSMPEFQALPAGIYNCEIVAADFGESKAGNPMITFQFSVLSEDPALKNRKFFLHTLLNKDAGKARLRRILVRAIPEYPLAAFDPQAFSDSGVALGKKVKVKVATRPYTADGVTKRVNDVKDVMSAEEEGFIDDIQ